jgi:hypothetical protein
MASKSIDASVPGTDGRGVDQENVPQATTSTVVTGVATTACQGSFPSGGIGAGGDEVWRMEEEEEEEDSEDEGSLVDVTDSVLDLIDEYENGGIEMDSEDEAFVDTISAALSAWSASAAAAATGTTAQRRATMRTGVRRAAMGTRMRPRGGLSSSTTPRRTTMPVTTLRRCWMP